VCRDESPAALAEGLAYFLDGDRSTRAEPSVRASAALFSRERFQRAWRAVFAEAS
jgi:hypothetical protein